MSEEQEIEELPEIEELVVATVKSITRYGAYLQLEDYPCEGFIHISAVSSRWIRKVSEALRVGQKIVVKVLRVDPRARSVDVSLKEVPPSERRRVLREWKKNVRGEKLLRDYAEKSGVDYEELVEKLSNLISKHSTIYDALERVIVDPGELKEAGLGGEVEGLYEFLSRRIKPRKYVSEGLIEVSFLGKGGIYKVKEGLERIEEEAKNRGLEVQIFSIGAPRYIVKMSSYKPEMLKRHSENILRRGLKQIEKMGGKASLVKKEEKIEY
ncbi:MAG: S1 RNA-binding domain-containing protein [Candidatus Geothermarchaeales archaeon]